MGGDAPKGALRTPDAAAQAFKLHDLTVVYKQVDVDTVVFDVPLEYWRIGGFEHHVLHTHLLHNPGRNIGAPWVSILSYAFRLDHDDGSACIQALSSGVD